MKRKIVKHGPSSLTISLPIKWVNQTGIRAGDEVDIEYEDNLLRVFAGDHKQKEKHITVDLSAIKEVPMERFLAIFYKLGYDEIKFMFKSPKIIQEIQKTINEMFIGYEIIEQTNQKCIIKNISGDRSGEFENIMRRLFLVTVSLANNSLDIIQSGKIRDIKEILVLETTNNKLSNYLHRMVIRGAFGSVKSFLYLIIWALEGVADDYRDICKYIQTQPKYSPTKPMLKFYEETNENLDMYYRNYYKFNIKSFEALRQKIKETRDSIKNDITNIPKEESVIYFYLLSLNVRLFELINATMAYEIGDNEDFIS
ncbi:AbrB/MazE/SpoVT family DNA-binding domain-containing protein [Candidatus Woesearchaeota archaeon]|nr:AbrB/MazE/SpoVT family DNA-binding domain-containing protein [Candidatus Woesearchaeota archaeon]